MTGLALTATPIIALTSCSQSKNTLRWGEETFVKTYDNLSYADEAKNATLINEVNYNLPTSNSMYQMLVYSFADGNNDGIGDFIGAKEKLKSIKELGFDQIWLSPIHPASSYHGYDVIDYTKVAPELGGMKAFDAFLKEAHQLNIKVYLDAVFNHTSYAHPWFQEAIKNPKSKYREYYHFSNKNNLFGDINKLDRKTVDSFVNLQSKGQVSNESYISKFWGGMPDLNLDNPQVIQELKNVQKFWIKKGVDGFRYDAFVEYFSSSGESQNNYNINKIFSELRGAGEEGAKEVRRNPKFKQFMMGEWWNDALSGMNYLKYGKKTSLNSTYDKKHWNDDPIPSMSASNMKNITSSLKSSSSNSQWNPTLDNHDWERWINKYQRDIRHINPSNPLSKKLDQKSVDAMSTALFSILTRPANPIIFQGDELAYHGTKSGGDANLREPIKWDDSKYNVSFTEKRSGPKTKIELNKSKDRPTFESQIKNPKQPAFAIKKINEWRRSNPFIGTTDPDTVSDASYLVDIDNSKKSGNIFIRKNKTGTKMFLIALSFEGELVFKLKSNTKTWEKEFSAYNAEFSHSKIKLQPNSYIVLEIK